MAVWKWLPRPPLKWQPREHLVCRLSHKVCSALPLSLNSCHWIRRLTNSSMLNCNMRTTSVDIFFWKQIANELIVSSWIQCVLITQGVCFLRQMRKPIPLILGVFRFLPFWLLNLIALNHSPHEDNDKLLKAVTRILFREYFCLFRKHWGLSSSDLTGLPRQAQINLSLIKIKGKSPEGQTDTLTFLGVPTSRSGFTSPRRRADFTKAANSLAVWSDNGSNPEIQDGASHLIDNEAASWPLGAYVVGLIDQIQTNQIQTESL